MGVLEQSLAWSKYSVHLHLCDKHILSSHVIHGAYLLLRGDKMGYVDSPEKYSGRKAQL